MADKQVSHPLELTEDLDEVLFTSSSTMSSKKQQQHITVTTSATNLHPSQSMPASLSTANRNLAIGSGAAVSAISDADGANNHQQQQQQQIPQSQSTDNAAITNDTTNDIYFSKFFIAADQVRWFFFKDASSASDSNNKTSNNATNPSPSNAAAAASVQAAMTTTNTSSSSSPPGGNSPRATSPTNVILNDSTQTSAADEDLYYISLDESGTSPPPKQTNTNKWQPFSKYDSYNLETEYREMLVFKKSPTDAKLVQVLNDLYEVDLIKRKCSAIYWDNEPSYLVMRAIWYQDNGEPFDEKTSLEIEKKHVELFKDSILTANHSPEKFERQENTAKMNSNSSKKDADVPDPIGTLAIETGILTWYAQDDVYFEKTKSKLFSAFGDLWNQKFTSKKTKTGSKVRRGFKENSTRDKASTSPTRSSKADEKPGEITHLVFVIHGIAQKLFQNNIVKKCDQLRTLCEKMKEDYLNELSVNNFRYAFLPIDWRSSLTLDDGIVDSITLKTASPIRNTLNSSALDIMYYTSPLFRTEIMSSLSSEINRLYSLFCQKNPYFKSKYNKVSLVAHSLGSVITYDILTSNNSVTQFSNLYGEDLAKEESVFGKFSQNNSELLLEYLHHKDKLQSIEKQLVLANANITPLEFIPENLFCLGSPLAVFLALRGVRPAGSGKQDHVLPKHLCRRLYNVFHPADPVAYRIEPLILKHYSTLSPIEIIRATQLSGKIDQLYKELHEKRKPLDYDLQATISKGAMAKIKNSKQAELEVSKAGKASFSAKSQLNASSLTASQHQQLDLNNQIDHLELEYGLDFKLTNSFKIQKILGNTIGGLTIAGFQAHACYWDLEDVALFIMTQLISNDNDSVKTFNISPSTSTSRL